MVKIKRFKKCPLKTTIASDILLKKCVFVSSKSSLKESKIFLKDDKKTSFLLKKKANKKSVIHTNKKIKRFFVSKKRIRLSFRKKLYRKFKKIFGKKRYNKNKFKLPLRKRKGKKRAKGLFYFKLTILIKKNNIFCNFSGFNDNKTLKSRSSGSYKIKVSKKTLRYTYDLVIHKFCKEIWGHIYVKKVKRNKKFEIHKRNKMLKKLKNFKNLKRLKNNKGNKKLKSNKKFKKNKKQLRKKPKKKLRKGLFINLICSTRLRKKVCKIIFRKFKKIPLIVNSVSKKIFNGCRPPKKVRKKRRRMRIYK